MANNKKKAIKVAKKPNTPAKTTIKKGKVAAKKSSDSKILAKKSPARNAVVKKAAPNKNKVSKPVSVKKTAKPNSKSAPAKKSAKPGVKKAAPKELSSSKKTTTTKPSVKVIKVKETPKKSVKSDKKVAEVAINPLPKKTKEVIQKPVKKTVVEAPVVHINEHKTENKIVAKKEEQDEKKKSAKPFVMPKTSTNKSRKYEPQFVKSVLDQAPEEQNGPSMRYSDAELNEFRELITRKLETAKKELGYLQGLITRKDEMGGDDTDNRYMTMEDGSLSMEREQLSQMASRQITFIDHLEKAMMRIENKTYGICRVTGKLIDKARLRAVPHATLSIEAKMGIAR